MFCYVQESRPEFRSRAESALNTKTACIFNRCTPLHFCNDDAPATNVEHRFDLRGPFDSRTVSFRLALRGTANTVLFDFYNPHLDKNPRKQVDELMLRALNIEKNLS